MYLKCYELSYSYSFFLLQNENEGFCHGDSGGPLVVTKATYNVVTNTLDEKATQIGIICCKVPSQGTCVNEYPGIYIRMEHKEVLDFVKEKVEQGTT